MKTWSMSMTIAYHLSDFSSFRSCSIRFIRKIIIILCLYLLSCHLVSNPLNHLSHWIWSTNFICYSIYQFSSHLSKNKTKQNKTQKSWIVSTFTFLLMKLEMKLKMFTVYSLVCLQIYLLIELLINRGKELLLDAAIEKVCI